MTNQDPRYAYVMLTNILHPAESDNLNCLKTLDAIPVMIAEQSTAIKIQTDLRTTWFSIKGEQQRWSAERFSLS